MAVLLNVVLIFALLVASEMWWRIRKPHDEFSRKFIHIFVGSIVAFWPFYISWNWILLLSAAFITVVAVSKYFNVFRSLHAVERPTWGEVLFALAVGVLAYVTRDPWIYAAALLHMSLADGLAAVVGVTWGRRTRYTVFRHPKSVIGSLTFFAVSIGILMFYGVATGQPLSPAVILAVAAAATFIENMGIRGLDNLLVPVLVGFVLTRV